jgi:hypothetical protein
VFKCFGAPDNYYEERAYHGLYLFQTVTIPVSRNVFEMVAVRKNASPTTGSGLREIVGNIAGEKGALRPIYTLYCKCGATCDRFRVIGRGKSGK